MKKNKKLRLLFLLFFPILMISCNDAENKDSNILWEKTETNIHNTKSEINHQEKKWEFIDSRDDKKYNFISIWEQVWMSKNFAYKPDIWNYWISNNNEKNLETYGYLYDWETAQKIAPEGWHIPTQDEWKILVKYLWGEEKAYNSLVEKWDLHWGKNNKATNDSWFAILPSWYFDQRDDSYNGFWMLTMFHSSTKSSNRDNYVFWLILNKNFKEASVEWRPIQLALPVRLIKD